MNKWLNFYLPFFDSSKTAEEFLELCENQKPPNNLAKTLMHQTQRLITLADEIPKIRPHEESLQILFLIMCAENISKLHAGYTDEGKSRYYVCCFFDNFLSETDKSLLGNGFKDGTGHSLPPLGLKSAVYMLYDIRCDVVHEGNYSFFNFHDGTKPIVNTDPDIISYLRYKDVRDLIIRGCINAIKDKLELK
jgi:hypothetical protein